MWHISELEKFENESEIDEDGEIDNVKESNSAVLLDKRYNGIESTVCSIVSDKKLPNGWLSAVQRARNQNIFSDRVIVESFFGRLCTFNLSGSKWRWSEEKHCQFLRFAVAQQMLIYYGTLYVQVMEYCADRFQIGCL